MFKRITLGVLGAMLLLSLASCGGTTGLALGWDYQDMDHDGIRNGLDIDVDGDGVTNDHDVYPLNPYAY